MTKEQKIQEAYGDRFTALQDYINDDGVFIGPTYLINDDEFKTWSFIASAKPINGGKLVSGSRPKSLTGIETNNEWIKIESEDDLPRVDQLEAYYVVMKKDNSVHVAYFNSMTHKTQWLENISHYQAIIHPKPPIY